MWLQNWFWKEEASLFFSSPDAQCWHSAVRFPGHPVNMCSSDEWNKCLGFQEENFKQQSWMNTCACLFFFLITSFCRYTLCVSVFLCCCSSCSFSCGPTLRNPVDCSSSVHGILQARILEWVASPFCRGSSWPRGQTCISCVFSSAGRFFTIEPAGKP